jgi:hypothetical protein
MESEKAQYFDVGDLSELAKQGLIREILLQTYPPLGITRATINLANGAKNCRVKLLNRKKGHVPVEKLFSSITGVHAWAYNLMLETIQIGNGFATVKSEVLDHQQITIDGIRYSEDKPFVWKEHNKK